ncbi:histone-lysine N-methyltransferase SETMAR [Trichonephila clavipes]|nr:histone-lysine N-methyltransferase SETMAR [Trichonephila clavipes]
MIKQGVDSSNRPKTIAVVPDFHKRILFSDEAHFWLNGYVNKQNCRIWSEANPQVCELQGVKNGSQQRENLVHFTVFFNKGENASQAAEIVNGVYGADTVTASYVQFWFRRFRSGIFDVKVAPRTGRAGVENVDKITEIIKVDRHVSSRSISRS